MTGAIRPWQVWKLAWVKARLRRRGQSATKLHALSVLERDRSAWAGLTTLVHAPLWRLRQNPPRVAARVGRYLLALGRIHPIKRLDLVLEALAGVGGLDLVIAGRGEPTYEARLRQRADRLGLRKRVTWVGHVSGPAKEQLLRDARGLVQASRLESFGVAVLEAMAAGVPVAVTDNVAAGEHVRAAGAGVVVGDSCKELAEGFRSIVRDPGLWDARAASAAAWSASLPSIEESGRALLAVYREVGACAS
jgi:glycosyltransferase involved in cell wall biosynthesis